ncbi:hypothetical protein FACS1894206_08960 [Deltaproteobacteria bacterium]|nr:hypothetical protein FACS1894206_08960 [Deltaproteobacteria bacterium]
MAWSLDALRPGRKGFAALSSVSSMDKVAALLGAAIALLVCAAVIAGIGARAASGGAEDVRGRYLPLLETAFALDSLVYEAVYHAGMFSHSGEMSAYSTARVHFASIRDTSAHFRDAAGEFAVSSGLIRDLDLLREEMRRLDLALEKRRTLHDALAGEQGKLRGFADTMGEILLDLQARIASAPQSQPDANGEKGEKADLLILGDFALAVEKATGLALAAGISRGAADLKKEESDFAARWEAGRDACLAASGISARGAGKNSPDPVGELEKLVASYRESLGLLRLTLEEASRLGDDRMSAGAKLTALTRDITGAVSAATANAAARADTALSGVAAIFLACVFLACALAAGAALTLIRVSASARRRI